jgi:copper chaperone
MITFEVGDMSCGHCVAAITEAVRSVDPGAWVEVDLAARAVRIEPASADACALAAALREAGYTPVAAGPGQGGGG